ncbi:uncharacterized protein LOC118646807 [Monomorium pharaonis]|uniref:uncharacterized protein LOC118646807 n=1 Tax=Monomorium pharaonis TaxID=307658 RepID=UPI001747002D|nr:uncharacterized protein LOC118646807 [Monomorium pharaonis]
MSMEKLRKQRSLLKGKMTTIRNFIIKATTETAPEEVTARLQAVEEIYARFQGISEQILTIDEADPADQAEDNEFDERYYSTKAALAQLLDKLKPRSGEPSVSGTRGSAGDTKIMQILEQQANLIQKLAERNDNETLARTLEHQGQLLERVNTQSSTSVREAHVKLPTMKLPTFDGNIEEWKRYSDTFKTLIHDSELSDVQKHQYLVGSLSGSAAKIIESIEISGDNYFIAWELLRERYDDKKGIKKRHMQCLLNELPKIRQESADTIQELVDHVQKHLRVLQAMKLPTDQWGDIIIFLIEKNLDSTTRRRWEEHIEDKENITTSTMMEFLRRHSQLLRRAADDSETGTSRNSVGKDNSDKQRTSTKVRNNAALATTTREGRCYLCQGQHLIYGCAGFLNLSVEDRIKEIKRLRLCLNCLRPDHFSRHCRSSSCRECGERHNTLCHIKRGPLGSSAELTRSSSEDSSEASVGATLCSMASTEGRLRTIDLRSSEGAYHRRVKDQRKRILMATAIVNVATASGDLKLRVLLDSASELNFVTSAACRRLNLNLDNIQEHISGLSDMKCTINHGCRLSISSRMSNFNLNLYCLVVPQVTKNLPSFSIQSSKLLIPENLKLADPLFFKPGQIDALIGGEFFLQLLDHGRIELGNGLPILQSTKFGWIIAGSVPSHLIVSRATDRPWPSDQGCLLIQQESIEDTIKRFWELEEYRDNKKRLSREEESCENHFINTTSRDALSGRFVVRLPFRENKRLLGRSRDIAVKRLEYLERKFQRNPEFRDRYAEFMREYVNLNHMSICETDNASNAVYLPHHGVVRESSLTTKLRVVFDASAKTTSGISLNDTLMVGATLQDSIIDIVMRFRMPAVAITADLQKMYRQILLHSNDRDYQRILWRFSPSDPIGEYRLNTVTYGQACAPFLAVRCVQQLARDEGAQFSNASGVLLNDLYIDDIITGVDCENQAVELVAQLEALLNKGGFRPHKWRTNSEKLIRDLRANNRAEESSALAIESGTIKTLGLNWCPKADMFQFSMDFVKSPVSTKREVLSTISRLFDPLGMVGPILTRAKLIMQETWVSDLDWDEPLTDNLRKAWDAYVEDVRGVGSIRVPRRVIQCPNAMRFRLHAFCDASMKAYGACIYLQSSDGNGGSSSLLLCSKSRVAPVKSKTITLPRLELCGAVVLVRLLQGVKRAIKIKLDEVHAWSDSTIALAWIAGDPSRQKTFVSNRTAEIQSVLRPEYWHHVDGGENPADLISRGTDLTTLRQSKIWWEGPNWLSRFADCKQREAQSLGLTKEDEEFIQSEQKSVNRVFVSTGDETSVIDSLLRGHSSLSRVERVLAWIVRFGRNARLKHDERKFGHISTAEIRDAHLLLIIAIQKTHFADATAKLVARKPITTSSNLLSLSPFVDERGVLRVGGRIQNSQLPFETKHPIVLPSNNKFTQMLFEREHRRLMHIGPQALLYSIREKYWPLKGKNIARGIVHNCITCSRNKPRLLSQVMGQLPADRVTPKRPFFVIGVDFAGPITTLLNRGRGRKTNKSYISLFVCFTTKAMHLEAVSDLSSASFVAALRRFAGRRGYPQRIYCDNATNFVGAKGELTEMYQLVEKENREIMDEFCIPNNVDWNFIPPSSPHMGGLWEAGVKSCKFHLKRVIGESLLTFEELSTALTQVEACLNSRPICRMPSTAADLQPLTPGHFLIGGPLVALPDIDVTDVPINRLDRWQAVQRIAQDFWKRWSREYLTSLQGKTKWTSERNNLLINDIVMIQDNNAPPLRWKLGRVIETHKGTDNKVRVVTLKTANGTCKRSINKLCKLPVSDAAMHPCLS